MVSVPWRGFWVLILLAWLVSGCPPRRVVLAWFPDPHDSGGPVILGPLSCRRFLRLLFHTVGFGARFCSLGGRCWEGRLVLWTESAEYRQSSACIGSASLTAILTSHGYFSAPWVWVPGSA